MERIKSLKIKNESMLCIINPPVGRNKKTKKEKLIKNIKEMIEYG